MKLSLIACIDEAGGLGKDGELLFKIPADLKRFKKLTLGHPIIMGRKTFDSIGHSLADRTNIVVTRMQEFNEPDCLGVNSVEEALEAAEDEVGEDEEVFVIGGGQLYDQTIDLADKLYLTIVKGEYEADTFFPDYEDFDQVRFEKAGQYGKYKYKFVELEKVGD